MDCNLTLPWSLQSSDRLAAPRTLVLNGGWDAYWAERRMLPLVANAGQEYEDVPRKPGL